MNRLGINILIPGITQRVANLKIIYNIAIFQKIFIVYIPAYSQ